VHADDERLSRLIAEILRLPIQSVNDELSLRSTDNWDSLTHMELIAAIEQEFSVDLTADDIVAMTTYSGIKSVLGARGVDV